MVMDDQTLTSDRNGVLNSASEQTRESFQAWDPVTSFGLTTTRIAFGHILTRLTAAKEEGAFVTAPDGSKIALGIPKAQKEAAGSNAHADIPLRRPGTATEAASVILAVASPLFSYVDGQTISQSFHIWPCDAEVTNLASQW